MDLRIGGAYEQALLKLAEYNQEPTATGMVRILIRTAAMEMGVWPGQDAIPADQQQRDLLTPVPSLETPELVK